MSIGISPSRTGCALAGLLSASLVACASSEAIQASKADFDGGSSVQWCDKIDADANCGELTRLAPTGMVVRAGTRGDLDGDGDEDALVVIERNADHADSAPRGLLLLRRDDSGVLREALSSPNAILCRKCGGMMGDPLHGVRAGHGEFTLRFEGGSRELWSSEYRFVYARERDLWLLTDIVHGGFDRADGKTVERRLTASDFGDVSLESFDPEDYPANALP